MAVFFFNDTATTEICTLSLHDALPIYERRRRDRIAFFGQLSPYKGVDVLLEAFREIGRERRRGAPAPQLRVHGANLDFQESALDRKSTRLNSSHANISYAVFCLKKKTTSAPVI